MKQFLITISQNISAITLVICLGISPGCSYASNSILLIQTDNTTIEFNVEIADTPEKHRLGLMYRDHLPVDSGMLFDYEQPKKVSMWMKNTSIPLDILFIDHRGVITHFKQNTVPYSEKIHSSLTPVSAVLEINAGLIEQYQIKTGHEIKHVIFNSR